MSEVRNLEEERKEEILKYDNKYHIRQTTIRNPNGIRFHTTYEKHFFVNGVCEQCGRQYAEEPGVPEGTVFLNYSRTRHITCVPRKHGRENSYIMQKKPHYFINGKCEYCGAPDVPDRSHASVCRTPETRNMVDMLFTHEMALQRDMIRGDLEAVRNSCRSRIEIFDTLDRMEEESRRLFQEEAAEQQAQKKSRKKSVEAVQNAAGNADLLGTQTFQL